MMPPPCGVEIHVRGYKKDSYETLKMPPPCGVESHVGCYVKAAARLSRCHPLAGWSLTLVATGKRVEIIKMLKSQQPKLAISVKLHGTRPWHLEESEHELF